jgi:hypothetical protein
MKKYIVALAVPMFLMGCSDNFTLQPSERENLTSVKSENHFVRYGAIQNLVRSQRKGTRSLQEIDADIYCYVDEMQDTLLYACNNPSGGWTMYATDTRVPVVLGESSKGTFGEALQNEELAAWVYTMSLDIKNIQEAEDDELNFTTEEIQENENFWKMIEDPLAFTPVDTLLFDKGNAILESRETTSHTEDYNLVSPLITTTWAQEAPYNNACPYKSTGDDRSPAGCVAIAAAQMLVFLHDSLGVPVEAPSEAYCNSRNNEKPFDWAQTNYTSTIWDAMKSNDAYAAPLIANVGNLCNMEYGDNGSVAYSSELPSLVFPIYGINCSYEDYNETDLKASLLSYRPVYLRAVNQNNSGHAFIVDRYKGTRHVIKTVSYYEYPDIKNPDGTLQIKPCGFYEITYTYGSPVISAIGMNWGWGKQYQDTTEWFTLTGDWKKGDSNYNINRGMIHKWSKK